MPLQLFMKERGRKSLRKSKRRQLII